MKRNFLIKKMDNIGYVNDDLKEGGKSSFFHKKENAFMNSKRAWNQNDFNVQSSVVRYSFIITLEILINRYFVHFLKVNFYFNKYVSLFSSIMEDILLCNFLISSLINIISRPQFPIFNRLASWRNVIIFFRLYVHSNQKASWVIDINQTLSMST